MVLSSGVCPKSANASMTTTAPPSPSPDITPAHPPEPAGRTRKAEPLTNRIRRDGKFFRLGTEKFYVKGVTYGPFKGPAGANAKGDEHYATPDQTARDFVLMNELGVNCLRVYHTPPLWFLDLALTHRLRVFVDIAWPKNLTFIGDEKLEASAENAVTEAAEACGNHPAVFAISVVNEIPAEIVRFVGRRAVEEFIDRLVAIVKRISPQCLVTFANYPTTEYLQPGTIDFVCFNVYLHEEQTFRNYLARLQSIAGEKPLMLGEYGIDTFREQSQEGQAEKLAMHVRCVFDEGLVGTFVFSFTDDWFVHGYQIEDWAFGLTKADRTPKASFHALQPLFARVPQLTDLKLPKASVVICSYNGASTVETCLASMRKLRYPEFEVLFIDDGSKDHTQDILKRYATETRAGHGITADQLPSNVQLPASTSPPVINIVQKNMGLSFARNVGMNAATGDVIIYTDSDCEADEDWLYFFCLALARGGSGYGGMGGPNLIPDEGSWIADCVGLSPGGPTHVMIDDRTAEHVPGCNMGFWANILRSVNGFDAQYRKAGDDVDVIWRIQNLGYAIGFSPSAQVWHYRRNSVEAYLKQQRGYGEAEALLMYKHPDHFNALGASHWRGRIYGGDQIGVRFGRDVIYHGIFGTGLFQSLYRKPASLVAAMLMSVEWHLLTGFVLIAGLALWPLLYLAGAMALVPITLAIIAALQSPMPKHEHPLSRLLIAYLHFRQPIARGWARYTVRLKAKGLKAEAAGYRRPRELPLDPLERRTLVYWHHEQDRIPLLTTIHHEVATAGWRHRIDAGWGEFDLDIYGSRYVKVRLTTATEHHHGSGKLTRVRVRILMSNFYKVLLLCLGLLTGLLLIHVWPFSRPAVLLPIAGWAMYLFNKWKVSAPVLGLIDAAAEKAGFYPVHAKTKADQAATGEK